MIKNLERATDKAREFISSKFFFKPISGKKEDTMYIITARIGAFEDVEVTFVIPENSLTEYAN